MTPGPGRAAVNGATGPSPTGAEGLRRGFRRRCAWCGVVLRGWQLNCCRMCKRAVAYSPSPPCVQRSRWDAEPDRARKDSSRAGDSA